MTGESEQVTQRVGASDRENQRMSMRNLGLDFIITTSTSDKEESEQVTERESEQVTEQAVTRFRGSDFAPW